MAGLWTLDALTRRGMHSWSPWWRRKNRTRAISQPRPWILRALRRDSICMPRSRSRPACAISASSKASSVAALPTEASQWFVYLTPAQTRAGVYLYGADVRYLVSADGATIVKKHPMHRSFLDSSGKNDPAGTKPAVVLRRKPAMPEYIAAGKHNYEIKTDGSISVAKQSGQKGKSLLDLRAESRVHFGLTLRVAEVGIDEGRSVIQNQAFAPADQAEQTNQILRRLRERNHVGGL